MNIEITQEELRVLRPMLKEAEEHVLGDLNGGELSETTARLLNVEHRLLLGLIAKLEEKRQLDVIEKGLKERGVQYEKNFQISASATTTVDVPEFFDDPCNFVDKIPLQGQGKAVAGHADTLLGAKRMRLRIHSAASAWRRGHPDEKLSIRTEIIAVNPYGVRLCDSYWDAPEYSTLVVQVWRAEK